MYGKKGKKWRLNPLDILTCRSPEDEEFFTKKTEKEWLNKEKENGVPGSQMKKVFQGGRDRMCQIL